MPKNDSTTQKKRLGTRRVLGWLLRYSKPYRGLFVVFVVVSIVEIFIGLLAPWSMKILVDNVLGSEPIPAWLSSTVNAFSLESKFSLLVAVCLGGLLIGLISELVSLIHT